MASGKTSKERFVNGSELVQNLGTNFASNITIQEDGYYFVAGYNGESKRWMKVSMGINGQLVSDNFTESGQWAYLSTDHVPLKAGTIISVVCYSTTGGGLYKET